MPGRRTGASRCFDLVGFVLDDEEFLHLAYPRRITTDGARLVWASDSSASASHGQEAVAAGLHEYNHHARSVRADVAMAPTSVDCPKTAGGGKAMMAELSATPETTELP
jgi:hypothetical protein